MDGPKTASITDLLKPKSVSTYRQVLFVKVLPHLYMMLTESSFTIGEAAKPDVSGKVPKKETPAHRAVI